MNPATEKQCPACDAVIPKSAEVCPECGTAQIFPPIAQAGGGSRILKGCLIAVGVFFVGIFVIGIISAILIPKFANTKQRAYVAEMRSDLQNLASAESTYRASHEAYESNVAALDGFVFSEGVTLIGPIDAGRDGWAATVKRDPASVQCSIAVGDRVAPGAAAATPICNRAVEVRP